MYYNLCTFFEHDHMPNFKKICVVTIQINYKKNLIQILYENEGILSKS